MNTPALSAALQGSDDWDTFTDVAGPFTKRVKAIKLTIENEEGAKTLTVTQASGASKSTGTLGLHVLEPQSGITAVTAVGAGVAEYRVYYE